MTTDNTTRTVLRTWSYNGTCDAPWPPGLQGWGEVPYSDLVARARSIELSHALPVWHYCDEMTSSGLYRFFRWETAAGGHAITAVKYMGATTMGAEGDVCPSGTHDDGTGNCVPDNVPDQPPVVEATCPPGTHDDGNGNCVADAAPPHGGGGSSSNEPIPGDDASCTWTPSTDGNTSDVNSPVGVATTISYNNKPIAWKDQSTYDQTFSGVRYRFVMWQESGKRMVAVFKCTPKGGSAPSASVSSSALPIVLALVAAVAIAGGAAVYASSSKQAA